MTVTNSAEESNLLDIDREPEAGKPLPRWVFIAIILVLTASACFGLGILVNQDIASHTSASGDTSAGSSLSVGGSTSAQKGQIIADSSTHQFYLPWCSEVDSISEANTVWFASEQAAEAKGYSAGQGCPGL
jgi:hypothetical protein